ncbi:MAG: PucR family transcriptional regulator [Solirubrobacteraceae bacterium]
MRAESQPESAEQLAYQRSQGLATLATVLGRVDLDAIACRMVDAYCAEIESYSRLPHAVLEGRKFDVTRASLALFLDLVEKQREIEDDDLEIARAGARADARDGIPLDDLLQAYRIGGLVCWREVIPHGRPEEQFAAVAAGELYVHFAETMSTAVTAAYHDEIELMGSREDHLQRALYEGIVGEEAGEHELRALADELRFPLLTSYLPFAAASSNGDAGQLARLLGGHGLLARAEGARVAGLAPDDDAERILTASGATYAIGAPVRRSELGAALEDQRTLLDLGLHAGRAGTIGQREFLIERCLVRRPWLGSALEQHLLAPLEEHDRDNGSELVATLQAFVGVELSRKAAARNLHIHPNTLDYRLDQINRLTGVRLGQPRDLTLVTLALAQRELPEPPGSAEPDPDVSVCDKS